MSSVPVLITERAGFLGLFGPKVTYRGRMFVGGAVLPLDPQPMRMPDNNKPQPLPKILLKLEPRFDDYSYGEYAADPARDKREALTASLSNDWFASMLGNFDDSEV